MLAFLWPKGLFMFNSYVYIDTVVPSGEQNNRAQFYK